jgi:hypothetical protein
MVDNLSGSRNFSVNARDVCKDALFEIGEIADGESIDAGVMALCMRRLNMMIKGLSNTPNFIAMGMKVWNRKRIVLNLGASATHIFKNGATAKGDATTQYDITNPSGTTFRYTYADTGTDPSITGAYITGDTITIASGGTMNAGNIVTAVTITGSGENYIEITNASGVAETGVTGALSHNSAIDVPIRLMSVLRRNSDNTDRPLEYMTFEDYEALPVKSNEGTPTRWFYERNQVGDKGTLYLNYVPSDLTDSLPIVYHDALQDVDGVSNDVDFPQEWYLPLYLNLATLIGDPFGREITATLAANAEKWLAVAQTFDPEETSMYFQPGLDYDENYRGCNY